MMHRRTAMPLFAAIVFVTVMGTQEVLAQSYTSQSAAETKYAIESRKLQWQYPSSGSSSSGSSSYSPTSLANVPTLAEIFGIKRKPKLSALEKAKAAGDQYKVIKLLKEKAQKGDVEACYELGEVYDTADEHTGGISPEAAGWYKKAALNKHAGAMYALSRPYRLPIGVTKSEILEGKKWLEQAAYARHPEAAADLRRYTTDWNLVTAMKRILQYDQIGKWEASLNIAWAKRDGKYGYIDRWGNEVVPVKFDGIWGFFEGLAVIKANGKYGYITTKGAYIEPAFDSAGNFSRGLAIVKLGGKAGVINKEGEVVAPFQYDHIDSYKEGRAEVRLNGKRGLIDASGKEITPPRYDEIGKYVGNKAPVRLKDKYGLIDASGKEITPPQYAYIDMNNQSLYWKGLAVVSLHGKLGLIDSTGKEIVPPRYDEIGEYHKPEMTVRLKDKWGLIDSTGKEIVPPKYDKVGGYVDGKAAVRLNGKWGFVGTSGKEIIPLVYDAVKVFDKSLVAVNKGGVPDDWEVKDGKWGVINSFGEEIIPLQYDEVRTYVGYKGVIEVRKGRKWISFDKQGKPVKKEDRW